MSLAVYPGSFDPITNGHIDLIHRTSKIFDELVVAVAINVRKQSLFTVAERVDMIQEAMKKQSNVRVDTFDTLLIDYAAKVGAKVAIRGLRAVSDFEAEFQMALTNRSLLPGFETFFLMASEPYVYLSSNMVKEIAMFGGDISSMVPKCVADKLYERIARDNLSNRK
ncbi:MAG: pantetheine-phosphate adenylyltransferase [Candidatus Alcyoniella australis]|nr:pantetheine-phosphate adenylyltransferase [Candidatus Alcyoniella australis]